MGDKYKVGTGQSKSPLTSSIESDALPYLTLPVPRSLNPAKIKSYEIEASLKGHKKAVYCCAFEPTQGFYIATCSHDMTCVVWDVRTRSRVRALKEHAGWIMHLAWTPDGNFLITASADKTIKMFSAHQNFVWSSYECIHTFVGHSGIVMGIAITPDSSKMISCGKDKTIRLWDLKDAVKNLLRKESDRAQIYCIKGNPEYYDGHAHTVMKACFNPNGTDFMTCSEDMTIKRWLLDSGELVMTYTGHKEPVLAVHYRYDGVFLASASHDKTVKLWDVENGRCAMTLKGHKDAVYDVKFTSPTNKGRFLISCGHDSRIIVWDSKKNFDVAHIFGTHLGWILSVAISPDGYRFASTGGDHRCNVYIGRSQTFGECYGECCHDCSACCSLCC